jgi:phenylacetate-CoA ligase
MSKALSVQIPRERRERNPLITLAGYRRLLAIEQHVDAPTWNYAVGDRVRCSDLPAVETMREAIRSTRAPGTGSPPARIIAWVTGMRGRAPLFRQRIPAGFDLARDWGHLPTMGRRDIAWRPEEIAPIDERLDRLIVYDTSGVTGHAIHVPHHPRAVAQNQCMLEYVLERHGVSSSFSPEGVACLNVGAQLNTVVFANVFSIWSQAGFAKVNLHPHRWAPDRARRFFREMNPLFLTGDPIGFHEMLRWGIDLRPAAMISTAVRLEPAVQAALERRFRCPVIDTYSTTETGPIAYADPDGAGLRILPVDLFVEIVDESGLPVAEGEHGEICVTGGRNPYLPLLRYRTGDFGRLRWSDLRGSDPAPRLVELNARDAVAFVAADGTTISPVDVGREIRAWAFVLHEFL